MAQHEPLKQELQAAVEGLLYPSESDEPFVYVCWAGAGRDALDERLLVDLLGVPLDTPVEIQSPEAFFSELTEAQDWWEEQEGLEAEKYGALKLLLEEKLTSLTVFRVGEVEVAVYILGVYEADVVGLRTVSVET